MPSTSLTSLCKSADRGDNECRKKKPCLPQNQAETLLSCVGYLSAIPHSSGCGTSGALVAVPAEQACSKLRPNILWWNVHLCTHHLN